MSDNTPRPDRADHNDPDIPTYDQAGSTPSSPQNPTTSQDDSSRLDPYERAGRAAPQEIPATEQTGSTPASAASAGAGGSTPAGATTGDEGTTAFPAQDGNVSAATGSTGAVPASSAASHQPQNQPTYRDEDFAPAGSTGAAGATASQYPANDQAATAYAPAAVPAAAPAAETAQPMAVGDGEDAVVDKHAGKRGTIDFGLLLARLLLGVWLVIESVGTFFQLGGNDGLAGLEAEFAGYPLAGILAIAVPTMQLAAGVFLIVGLVTPVAAAVATVATGFVALHELAAAGAGLNVFAWPEPVWLALVLFGLSIAIQFTGPGYYGLDNGRSWARRPLASSWIFIVVALIALGALWWFGTAINPFA